ncbi:AAA family ATPase [Geosporobacter ferrireducens]|uniref:AAA family ATPase n=1 Tax=Geosporobacter ferrireducens TaxID=1424294 RepID=UPI00139C0B66|nr:AAA family ATPase [Geosporobacter ferrireducens]MTI57281.1 hypothetical protein [Geosporobacter ferrireducens]
MKLIELELFNFKQYYGKQKITFAGHEDESKNVTVIYGENGRGKTTLYRALIFCLFGDRVLDQDQNYDSNQASNPDIYITNLKALEEDYRDTRKGVKCYVKATFVDKNKHYVLERGLNSIQFDSDQIIEDDDLLRLTITEETNKDILDAGDKDKIDKEIHSIIDPRVKSFFLFDGERIERLTKATKEQKTEVAKGIKNLLKIDNLDVSVKSLEMLENKINKELQKVSSGDHLKKLKEIEKIKSDINKIKDEIINNEEETKAAEKHKEEIDNELSKYEDIKELLRKRKELEGQKVNINAQKDSLFVEMRRFNQKSSYMLAKDPINFISADIDQKRVRGQVPSDIKKELIDRILSEMKCICGRELQINSPEHLEILKWNQQAASQVFASYIMDFYRELGVTTEKIESNANKAQELLVRFGQLDEQLDEVSLLLEQIKEELGDIPNIDIASKEKYRDTLTGKIAALEVEHKNLEKDRVQREQALEKAQREREELAKQVQIHEDLNKKYMITQNAINVLKDIKSQFVKDIIIELEQKANDIFQKLIDTAGKQNLKWIRINPDYSLEVLDWNDRPFLANISAGQRQVVSLSFITALAQTAGGSKVLELPLFMDTPFGRLGGAHRDHLLEIIPTITPQWILLATETEFTTSEYKKLKDTGKWEKIYSLEVTGAGVTQINPEHVATFRPKR